MGCVDLQLETIRAAAHLERAPGKLGHSP